MPRQLLLIPLVFLLAGMAPMPLVGDQWQVRGRVERVDHDAAGDLAWVRQLGMGPILVQLPQGTDLPEIGQWLEAEGMRQPDRQGESMAGDIRQWPVIQAAGVQYGEVSEGVAWNLIIGLVAGFLILVGVCALRPNRHTRRPSAVEDCDWPESEEITDLSVDPAEALAELARRADEGEA